MTTCNLCLTKCSSSKGVLAINFHDLPAGCKLSGCKEDQRHAMQHDMMASTKVCQYRQHSQGSDFSSSDVQSLDYGLQAMGHMVEAFHQTGNRLVYIMEERWEEDHSWSWTEMVAGCHQIRKYRQMRMLGNCWWAAKEKGFSNKIQSHVCCSCALRTDKWIVPLASTLGP